MEGLYQVRRGNEQFWCPPEQVDYWASQGCSVYELTPTQIAGSEAVEVIGESQATASSVVVNERSVTPKNGKQG